MNINKILEAQTSEYQLTVARAVVNFWRADTETRAQLLDSYQAIILEDEFTERLTYPREPHPPLDVDAYLDDPRHGQGTSKGER